MTLKELRHKLADRLKEGGIASGEKEAALFLMHMFGLNRTQLLISDLTVDTKQMQMAEELLERRLAGEPVQYIVGETEFMSLPFLVNRDVLIPRPETELLVETVLERLDGKQTEILDIGCGSGCIGISLAHDHAEVRVTCLDISGGALRTAEENARRNHVEDRMRFLLHDVMIGFPPELSAMDFVVSNPPYIQTAVLAELEREVADFEPVTALDGGEDGLKFYRKIIREAPLKSGGSLAFEIGFDQGTAVKELMGRGGYKNVTVLQDLEKRDRVVIGTK